MTWQLGPLESSDFGENCVLSENGDEDLSMKNISNQKLFIFLVFSLSP